MKLSKLYEEAMSQVYMDFDYEEDGIEIKALRDGKIVGKLNLTFVYDAWHEFEDAVENGDLPEEDYIKIFPNDTFAKIEHLDVVDGEKGKGYAKMLVQNAIITAKKEGYKVMYLNASPMGHTGLGIHGLTEFYKSFGFQTLIDSGHNVEMFLNI